MRISVWSSDVCSSDLVGPAVLIAGAHWPELTHNLADQVLAADNLLIMALCYPAVKIVHELGHGFAAKAYGREVREMGVMLLVLFPVPYVDASAASALPGKWHRALVGAAGLLSALFVAAPPHQPEERRGGKRG